MLPLQISLTTKLTSCSNFLNGQHQHVFSNMLFHLSYNKILNPSLISFLNSRKTKDWNNKLYNAWFEVHQVSFLNYHSHRKINITHSYHEASIFFLWECNNSKFCLNFSFSFSRTLLSLICKLGFSWVSSNICLHIQPHSKMFHNIHFGMHFHLH